MGKNQRSKRTSGDEKAQRHLAGKSGLSLCPGMTTAVTEGGTGT